jgi:hypothetical protein
MAKKNLASPALVRIYIDEAIIAEIIADLFMAVIARHNA